MAAIEYPESVRHLVLALKQLPGIGQRSAERLAIWLLSHRGAAGQLAECVTDAVRQLEACPTCGFFLQQDRPCSVCGDPMRDDASLCVVEQPTDVLPLDRTGAFKGRYLVLGGRLSPLDNVGPDDLRIALLLDLIRQRQVREVILALGSDVEGEATAHYLADLLQPLGIRVTRLAQGLPAGGGLEQCDELTLFRALQGRRPLTKDGAGSG